MWLSEQVLYGLAKLLYRSEMVLSTEMKQALSEREKYNRFRSAQLARILSAARQAEIEIQNKVIVDLGCGDGAITSSYLDCGARRVIGVDIDAQAIDRARANWQSSRLTFLNGRKDAIPVETASVDVVICFDVFEHVSQPRAILDECHRILKPGGKMLIGTWGWYHPYAPHLFVMPVPGRTSSFRTHGAASLPASLALVRAEHDDLDKNGSKRADKYLEEAISTDFVNKLLMRDHVHAITRSRFSYRVSLQPFSATSARWSRIFLHLPWVREFVTSYVWYSLAAA